MGDGFLMETQVRQTSRSARPLASLHRKEGVWDMMLTSCFFGWFERVFYENKKGIRNAADVESIELKSFLVCVCVGYNLCEGKSPSSQPLAVGALRFRRFAYMTYPLFVTCCFRGLLTAPIRDPRG